MATKTSSGHVQNVQAWNKAVHVGTDSGYNPFDGGRVNPGTGYYPTKVVIGGAESFNFGTANSNGGYYCKMTDANGNNGITLKSGTCAKVTLSSISGGTNIAPLTKTFNATEIASAKSNLCGKIVGIAAQSNGTADIYWRGNYDYTYTFSNNFNITKTAGNGGTLSGVSNADYNTSVTITAVPDNGYRLTSISTSGGTNVSTSGNSITFTMPAKDVTVTAEFDFIATVNYYDGSEWQECYVYYYDGTDWCETIPMYYDGTDWYECTHAC